MLVRVIPTHYFLFGFLCYLGMEKFIRGGNGRLRDLLQEKLVDVEK
jgi:hypothetical protein